MRQQVASSMFYSPFAVSTALLEGSRHVEPRDSRWQPGNQNPTENGQFLERYYEPAVLALTQRIVEEVRGKGAKGTVDPVNQFLRENKFTIQLRGPIGPSDLALAAIMKIAMRWEVPGTSIDLLVEQMGGSYVPGVEMKKKRGGIRFTRSGSWREPIVEIKTNANQQTRFFMTMLDEAPGSFFELYELGTRLATRSEQTDSRHSKIIFPKVDLRVIRPELTEIIGLTAGDGIVTQAMGESTFKMNEIGARAEDAAAVGIEKSPDMGHYFILNKPLLVWATREGINLPLFAAWVNTQDWKDPGNLFADKARR